MKRIDELNDDELDKFNCILYIKIIKLTSHSINKLLETFDLAEE